jgi:hypothetical protein
MLEAQFGFAQTSAYIQKIAWPGTRAQDGVTRSRLSDDGNTDQHLISPRGVSSGQDAPKLVRRAPQTLEEFFQPATSEGRRQCQAKKKAARRTTHGGDVASGSSKALPARTIGGMLVSQEMRAFQEPVASQDRLEARLRAEKRGIIADT